MKAKLLIVPTKASQFSPLMYGSIDDLLDTWTETSRNSAGMQMMSETLGVCFRSIVHDILIPEGLFICNDVEVHVWEIETRHRMRILWWTISEQERELRILTRNVSQGP